MLVQLFFYTNLQLKIIVDFISSNKMSNTKKKLKLDQNEIIQPKNTQDVFNFANFKQNLSIEIKQCNNESIQFDMQGIDASVANALRRIIIAEVPTMAFHKVFLYQNTSVLPDELLVHRLGLIPLKVDSQDFKFRKSEDQLNQSNSLKFSLKVTCTRKQPYKKMKEEEIEAQGLKPEDYLINHSIYSKSLKWIPQGNQKNKMKDVRPVYENILLAKLRENQEINLEIYAEKGIGKKHAKWSPVSTAFYRLMPELTIQQNFMHDKYAQTLVDVCPGKVFAMKKGKAVVKKSRDCTTCRQCLKLDGIALEKIKDHFIFTIESTGILTPIQIFERALDILDQKSKAYSL